MTTTPNRHYRLQSDVRFRVIDGEAVVVKQDANQVIVLNEVGTFVFPLLSDDAGFTEIVDRLIEEFKVTRETATTDLKTFIDQLEAARIITEVTA